MHLISLTASHEGLSNMLPIFKGVPQGSILAQAYLKIV
jgi:hypothetical protein